MKHDMTGTIQLSVNDSVRMRQNLILMNENREIEEYFGSGKYFDSLAESMTIHLDGVNTTVEFEDLDLPDLDALIQMQVLHRLIKKT